MSPRPLAGIALAAALLPAWPAAARTCAEEAGSRRAADYVRHCRDVATAGRGLCHAGNACSVLIGEIRRGCRDAGADSPNLCGAYVGNEEDDEDE